MTLRIVAVNSIHVDNTLNVSRGGNPITPQDVASLSDDIKANGLLEEIGVIHIDNAEWIDAARHKELLARGFDWILIYGFRRYRACELAGFTSIKVSELGENVSLAEAELANIAENWGRKPPNEYDLAVACHRFATVHGLKVSTIAQRTQKSVRYIEEAITLVSKLSPALLQLYKANCTRAMRRKMLELAVMESDNAVNDRERYSLQEDQWRQMEMAEVQAAQKDPDVGKLAPVPARPGLSKTSGTARNLASRSDWTRFAERLIVATQWWDGLRWHPMTDEARAAFRSAARWSVNPDEEMPFK